MLGNLMPPPVAEAVRRADVVDHAAPAAGFIVVHPRYRTWLSRCGVTTAAAALALPGEVVSGHPDRHVVRAEVGTRAVYLKREHRIGWRVRLRNRRAGFGGVSRSEREAATLRRLEEAGLPGPQWIAYGEDGRGRAFLLVDELAGSVELRDSLADPAADRRELAAELGRAAADLHAAGFDTPDLSAKHVFVRPGTHAVAVIDWASAGRPGAVPGHRRLRALANLAASVGDALASTRDRLRAVRAYLKASPEPVPFAGFVRTLAAEVRAVEDRPSLREQRQPRTNGQRLVWLAGEAAVAVPAVAAGWPTPAVGPPFYPHRFEPVGADRRVALHLPAHPDCTLLRFRGRYAVGRLLAAVRGRAWRSPAAVVARLLFHLDRYGVDAPPLLAFGQRTPSPVRAESFVLFGLPADAPTLRDALPAAGEERRRRLFQLGAAVRGLHEAGCVGGGAAAYRVTGSRLVVDPSAGVRHVRRVSDASRTRDLIQTIRGLGRLSRADVGRVLRGYRAGRPADDRTAKRLAAAAHRQTGGR
jgi:tRNA A-37 threonylcarbamoyl transferase component Bud32